LIGEERPLDEVDHVGADIGEAFAVLCDIEEPGGTAQGCACHDFHDVVDAARFDADRVAEISRSVTSSRCNWLVTS